MDDSNKPFFIQKGNIYAVPILHYNRETAIHVKKVFDHIKPDCIAVELPETTELQAFHAASRLPDLSIILINKQNGSTHYLLCEPCDGTFEALRSALENGIPAKCIDLDIENYPNFKDYLPDPYAIFRIGLEKYYKAFLNFAPIISTSLDEMREIHMAKKLKELSFSYDKILFVSGMIHVSKVLSHLDKNSFPKFESSRDKSYELCTLTDESARHIMAEFGWLSMKYEEARNSKEILLDRQRDIFELYQQAGKYYEINTGNPFKSYHLKNTMKFVRNYALISNALMPDLYQILSAAKGCVDHNYAYEVFLLGTSYPYLKNVDNLPALNLSVEEVWGKSKIIKFHKKLPSRKGFDYNLRKKDKTNVKFNPPNFFSLCSHQPEDSIVENFGRFLQKKTIQLLEEESSKVAPFSTSLEDGIDTKETIRHWYEKKLYVKKYTRKKEGIGSVVMIFDEDSQEDSTKDFIEKFPWKLTWNGENDQESDMAFYATDIQNNVIGPGISRCEYGGFMMSYPPKRMINIWQDPDYSQCRSKSEVLLMAAIDYAIKPIVTYVAPKPPRSFFKTFASHFGKKIVYIPISQISPMTINKIRSFHVLDGIHRRKDASDYIF